MMTKLEYWQEENGQDVLKTATAEWKNGKIIVEGDDWIKQCINEFPQEPIIYKTGELLDGTKLATVRRVAEVGTKEWFVRMCFRLGIIRPTDWDKEFQTV